MPRQTSAFDPRISDALRAAEGLIAQASVVAFTNAVDTLLERMRASVTYLERGQFAAAHSELLKHRDALQTKFNEALREKVTDAARAKDPEQRANENTDWDALSLVEPDQIEERISFERIGQVITHECEAELRELNAYASAMLEHGWTDPERNPLRGNVVGSALHAAIESAIEESAAQKLLSSELGLALAKALPPCYRAIINDLNARGFRPADLAVRRAAPPGSAEAGPVSAGDEAQQGRWEHSISPGGGGGDSRFDEPRSRWERSMGGRPPTGDDSRFEDSRLRWERSSSGRPPHAEGGDTLRSWNSSILGRYGNIDPVSVSPEYFSDSAASLLDRLVRGGIRSPSGSRTQPSYNAAPPQADADLMDLLRRINDGAQTAPASVSASMTPGVPTNLIRAHHDELVRASQGKLDHLLIELVSNLFDQILSDKRVSPQMAVQIARLQLPVLRVALRDPSFFSSRRHPVRRFVNRIAGLGLGIADFDNGSGKELLGRINGLISEIVEGDFDQIGLYEAKLIDLEEFTAEQLRAEVRASEAGETVAAKELEWRLHSAFLLRMQAALEPISLPPYLKEFLGQEWARVILMASQRHGDASAAAKQSRRTGYDLVVSIQPKLTLKQRMDFISNLPALMAQLNNGMALIEWPAESRGEFLGKLVSEHAGSLKAPPASELDYNMLLRRVEAAFRTPIPDREELEHEPPAAPAGIAPPAAGAVRPPARPIVVEQRFSPEEASRIGLIAEDVVNWSSPVVGDVASAVDPAVGSPQPLALRPGAIEAAAGTQAASARVPGLDETAEPTEGPQLRHHLQLGISYQLQLKDQWENVRLAYMSPARNLFLFTHGSKGRQAISMTARMLERLCEARRMRTLEAASLIDRATAGVQRHLASLKPPPKRAAG